MKNQNTDTLSLSAQKAVEELKGLPVLNIENENNTLYLKEDDVVQFLLDTIQKVEEEAYKRGFQDCQKMAKSGKYPELRVHSEKEK